MILLEKDKKNFSKLTEQYREGKKPSSRSYKNRNNCSTRLKNEPTVKSRGFRMIFQQVSKPSISSSKREDTSQKN